LCQRLEDLFPGYPPQRGRDSGLGAREPELGESGPDAEPRSGIPNREPRTPDPDPVGVGTKPECDVESADSCPTSPSRIQQDAGVRDSGLRAREPELGESGPDAEPKSGIPNPEPRAPGPDAVGAGTKPEFSVESTDSSPTSPSRIQQDAGIRDSGLGLGKPNRVAPAMTTMITQGRNPNPEPQVPLSGTMISHDQVRMRPPPTINRQSAIDNRQSPIPCYRTAQQPCALWPSASGTRRSFNHLEVRLGLAG